MLNRRLDLRDALEHIVSVSELGRGKASKVIQNVEDKNEQYIVVKNNKPQAVIISIEEYNRLLALSDELELLKLATLRVAETSESDYSSFNDVLEELGISHDDLDSIEDDVDID